MITKPLDQLGNELDNLLDEMTTDRREFFMFTIRTKYCGYCSKLIKDYDNLTSVFKTGMCLSCDHAYGETLEDL